MIVSIHQPSYFPWLGLLDKIAKSDTFILLDNVQLVKGTFQYRNQFFCNGKSKILTLPIDYHLGDFFIDIIFKDYEWINKHLDLLRNYYCKTPYFNTVYADLVDLYKGFIGKTFIDVLSESILFCMDKLGVKSRFLFSSEIGYEGKKGEMVLDLCKRIHANKYLAGMGSRNYMLEMIPIFESNGIEVIWHNFTHPIYVQEKKYPFVEGLSAIDMFMFYGYEGSRQIFHSI